MSLWVMTPARCRYAMASGIPEPEPQIPAGGALSTSLVLYFHIIGDAYPLGGTGDRPHPVPDVASLEGGAGGAGGADKAVITDNGDFCIGADVDVIGRALS